MVIKGTVSSVIFCNEQNGYTVADIDVGGSQVTAVGVFPALRAGEAVVMTGEVRENAKFGRQFAVESVEFSAPTDESGIEGYLSSGLFKGVGPVLARAIVAKFGLETLNIIEKAPERLRLVKGVSPKRAEDIGDAYKQNNAVRDTLIFLQKLGLTTSLALKIYEKYKEKAVKIVKDNPYKLVTDIDGVGFLTADKIADSLGIAKNSEYRLGAGVVHVLSEASERDGHTFLPADELLAEASKLLTCTEEEVSDRLNSLVFQGLLKKVSIADEDGRVGYALRKIYNLELGIKNGLLALENATQGTVNPNSALQINIDEEIKAYEAMHQITLHEGQKRAVTSAIGHGVSVITGGPGTGKTTIIKCIIAMLSNRGKKFLLCSPTGRAAKRMAEATGKEAKTIHRLLGATNEEGKLRFQFNKSNPLDVDVLIIDEISMADIYVFDALLKAMPCGSRLVMVGDKDQLPSVSAGAILADIIKCERFSVSRLSQIYRQSEDSLIAYNAQRINHGEMPVINNKSRDFFLSESRDIGASANEAIAMFKERIPSFLKVNREDIQILAPMKKGVAGVDNLNRLAQLAVNPDGQTYKHGETVFRVGDRVMHTKNNYSLKWEKDGAEGEGVFNGDVGRVAYTHKSGLTVAFEDGRTAEYSHTALDELMLAYAVTVHKSQGSEYKVVILVLSPGSSLIMTRNLLYTAVSRAKEMAVIVGSRETLSYMVKNEMIARRYTMLAQLLREGQ